MAVFESTMGFVKSSDVEPGDAVTETTEGGVGGPNVDVGVGAVATVVDPGLDLDRDPDPKPEDEAEAETEPKSAVAVLDTAEPDPEIGLEVFLRNELGAIAVIEDGLMLLPLLTEEDKLRYVPPVLLEE
ncbi:hypothetical protein BGZ83_004483 [Gryganskiella cystojenkinii]|nr:hypothetical protein BGZ83_004483 [Gryganskiella cystojenkinii]